MPAVVKAPCLRAPDLRRQRDHHRLAPVDHAVVATVRTARGRKRHGAAAKRRQWKRADASDAALPSHTRYIGLGAGGSP